MRVRIFSAREGSEAKNTARRVFSALYRWVKETLESDKTVRSMDGKRDRPGIGAACGVPDLAAVLPPVL